MSKNEFLNQLSILLSDISPEERDEAIAYYREYIEDAGLENEEAIMEELGTPEEVAAEIKSGIFNKNNQDIDYSSGSNNVKNSPEPYFSTNEHNHQTNSDTYYSSHPNPQTSVAKKNVNIALIILAIFGAILLSPIWLGLLVSIFGVLIGFLATVFGLIFGFGVAGVICFVVGAALFIWGFPTILHNALAGIALIGAGLVVAALGILFLLLTGWLCIGVIPWFIRCISRLIHRLTNHNKEAHV